MYDKLTEELKERYHDIYRKAEVIAEAKGEARGRYEGETIGKRDMARSLRNSGVDLDTISKASGLTRQEIATL